MKLLLLLASGMYIAFRLEQRHQNKLKNIEHHNIETSVKSEKDLDSALEDSFPASDPPSITPPHLH